MFSAWMFELWADKVKILEPQDLLSALSSFYELAFCFQLQYAKEAQTVCNIIQLRICKYGDPDTGTLTTHLSPGVSLIFDLAHDSGILQSELFTSRSQNLVLAKLLNSGFWRYGQFFQVK